MGTGLAVAATAVGLALTSGLALTALAATAIGQIPLVGALGDWSVGVLHRDDPASLTLALTACVLLVLAFAAEEAAYVGDVAVSVERALLQSADGIEVLAQGSNGKTTSGDCCST